MNAIEKNIWPHAAAAAYTRGYVWYTNCYLIYTGPMILQLNKIKQVEDQWVIIQVHDIVPVVDLWSWKWNHMTSCYSL